MTISNIEWLQDFYLRMCDGDWEHSYGVCIDTLDNPGWRFQFDLEDTALANIAFESVQIHRSEHDWIVCRREGAKFYGHCGPRNLSELISLFREWAERNI